MLLNDYIDAVLLNNPYAVQDKLQQLGILQAGSYDPDYLKQVIVREVQGEGKSKIHLLPDLLDVPIQLQGPYADELAGYQYAHGNRAMIESLLLNTTIDPARSMAADWSQLLQVKIGWRNTFLGLGLVIGLLFIILLIRKI